MNRQEFCEILVKAKKDSGVSTSELSFKLRMVLSTLRRFEKGVHSFNMAKCIDYLIAINHHIELIVDDKCFSIKEYSDLIAAFRDIRSTNCSVRALETKTGITRAYISNIEHNKVTVGIDKFLVLSDALNIQINIVPNAK